MGVPPYRFRYSGQSPGGLLEQFFRRCRCRRHRTIIADPIDKYQSQRVLVGAGREVVVAPWPGTLVVVVDDVEGIVVVGTDEDVDVVEAAVVDVVVVLVVELGRGAVVVVVTGMRTAGTSSVGRSGSGRTAR